jgi:hypothetical protein
LLGKNKLFSAAELWRNHKDSASLFFSLLPINIKKIYESISKLQRLLREIEDEDDQLAHFDLLNSIQPDIWDYYFAVYQNYSNPAERFYNLDSNYEKKQITDHGVTIPIYQSRLNLKVFRNIGTDEAFQAIIELLKQYQKVNERVGSLINFAFPLTSDEFAAKLNIISLKEYLSGQFSGLLTFIQEEIISVFMKLYTERKKKSSESVVQFEDSFLAQLGQKINEKSVERLYLGSFSLAKDSLSHILNANKFLCYLNLSGCTGLSGVSGILNACVNLQVLNVSESDITDIVLKRGFTETFLIRKEKSLIRKIVARRCPRLTVIDLESEFISVVDFSGSKILKYVTLPLHRLSQLGFDNETARELRLIVSPSFRIREKLFRQLRLRHATLKLEFVGLETEMIRVYEEFFAEIENPTVLVRVEHMRKFKAAVDSVAIIVNPRNLKLAKLEEQFAEMVESNSRIADNKFRILVVGEVCEIWI